MMGDHMGIVSVVCSPKASIVQWLEYLPSKQVARVRFPVDALIFSFLFYKMSGFQINVRQKYRRNHQLLQWSSWL